MSNSKEKTRERQNGVVYCHILSKQAYVIIFQKLQFPYLHKKQSCHFLKKYILRCALSLQKWYDSPHLSNFVVLVLRCYLYFCAKWAAHQQFSSTISRVYMSHSPYGCGREKPRNGCFGSTWETQMKSKQLHRLCRRLDVTSQTETFLLCHQRKTDSWTPWLTHIPVLTAWQTRVTLSMDACIAATQ